MSEFLPLSVREGVVTDDGRFAAPHEGVPPWLASSLNPWLDQVFRAGISVIDVAFVERSLHLSEALRGGTVPKYLDLRERMKRDEVLALDVVDLILGRPYLLGEEVGQRRDLVGELEEMLREAGSAWAPVPVEDGETWRLTRRVPGPGYEAIEALAAEAPRTGQHLRMAWTKLYGRHPDPLAAYWEAVRAVESAAKPIITPNASRATLGTMISAMVDAPRKWSFALGTTEDVVAMARLIWNRRFPRHGTDDETQPISVPMERAEPAVHVAVMLCQFFVSGAVRRADS